MSGQLIELLCYLSPQVRKAASVGNVNADFVTWRVNVAKPFQDIDNFGALSQSLGIHTLCELCDYSEGVVRDVIDTRRTPEELGFRPHMAVYLRQKRSGGSGARDGGRSIGSAYLSAEEEAVFNKLRDTLRSSMTPEEPCILCGRVVDGDANQSLSRTQTGSPRSRKRSDASPKLDMSVGRDTVSLFRLTSEVGVQCGTANRIGEPIMSVSFGSAARMKAQPDGVLQGFVVDEFPTPSTLGGPSFLKHDGEIVELKGERDRYKGERDQLANLLREEQRKVHELQRERQEHKCEGSEKVQKYIQEIERLQANLRDLMRGRDEVYSLLHQRRTAATSATSVGDAPRPYAPFRVGLPTSEPLIPNPHELLSKAVSSISREMPRDARTEVYTSYADEPRGLASDIAVVKRPSGPSTVSDLRLLQSSGEFGPPGHLDQPAGQAMLRMFSSVGQPYYVKRLIVSQLKRGRNALVLSSLDQVVTDEIDVDDLVAVEVNGEGMLALSTERNQWLLYMNSRERSRWVNWLFVLNPWLSTNKNVAVPNNY